MVSFRRKSKKEDRREVADELKYQEDGDGESKTMGNKINTLFKQSLDRGKKEALEAQQDLKRSLGLGHRPNLVPPGEADINREQRTIELGWHPVAGTTGKWFAEKTMIGQAITERIGRYPDPTQHWAVIVGDFVHQLWMDESLEVIYFNEYFKREDWHTFEVGKTRFNDQALRKAGQMTIHNMRERRSAYNLISNNCQNFAVNMLDNIQLGGHQQFATTFEIYQRATGEGTIKELYVDKHPEEQQYPQTLQQDEEEMPQPKRHDTLQFAQQVMDENTTKLDHDC
ncbi:hypothetical protein LTR37_015113 [Vermiconidia calcicola]|uniref:Uncharacterized protein n=1 Tax=Vermiconidia calcicola TaxID=1690605 RepID=A0ACC3MUJ0_9PEZI|nr:hypothetical protein LTR37_015113 [Vermiconidia calcicola]